MVKEDEKPSHEQSVTVNTERWRELGKEDLPSLDLVFQVTKATGDDLRKSSDALGARAAFVMGFATFSLGVLIDLVDKVNIFMVLGAGIFYFPLIRYAFLAYKIQKHGFPAPHPMHFIESNFLFEKENVGKLILIDYASQMIDKNAEINDERAKNLTKSLIAFLLLLIYLVFLVVEAKLNIIGSWNLIYSIYSAIMYMF